MIPIFIVSYNNGILVKRSVEAIRKFAPSNPITILDNASRFNDTLDILSELEKLPSVTVKKYTTNTGPWRVLRDLEFNEVRKSPFVLTDPDLDLSTLPENTLEILTEIQAKHKSSHVGLALNIFDKEDLIPSVYWLGRTIFEWEIQFWLRHIPDDKYELYNAKIDTTFCLYNYEYPIHYIRVAGPLIVKHLPWHRSFIKTLTQKQAIEMYGEAKFSTISKNILLELNYDKEMISVSSILNRKLDILTDHDKCFFVNEYNEVIPHKEVERQEQMDALIFIPSNASVLELGARYGTVSCLISKILTNPENHVVVEPDISVIPALENNKRNSNSKFQIYPGVISSVPVSFFQQGYGSIVESVKDSTPTSIPTITLLEMEQKYSVKFDTLVADCEGCIEGFVNENDLSNFKLILLEKDQPNRCDYPSVEQKFKELGFIMVRNHFNEVYRSVYVNVKDFPFIFLNWKVQFGDIGLNDRLGYVTGKTVTVKHPEGYISISAHAPSMIELELKTPVEFRGMINETSEVSPFMIFIVDGDIIGSLNQVDLLTDPIVLTPGKHTFEVRSTNGGDWGHSVWLYKLV